MIYINVFFDFLIQKSFLSLGVLDENERLRRQFVSQILYNICVRVVSDIQRTTTSISPRIRLEFVYPIQLTRPLIHIVNSNILLMTVI